MNKAQLRSLFGDGRHPDADRLVAEQLEAGKTPAAARRAGALGRKVKVTGADLVFRLQVTLQLLWALGDEETRKAIEAAHERAIAVVLAWIEDGVAVIRHGAQDIHRTRPAHGLVAARFRHYEARSGMPLLHDHLLLSLRALRPDGVWGVHFTALLESAVAAPALYNEVVMTEACEALELASEPRTVTAGRRPVMEVAGVPHELIRWTARRSEQIAVCLTDLEHEYVTATDRRREPEVRARGLRAGTGEAEPDRRSQDPPREAAGPFPRTAAYGLAGECPLIPRRWRPPHRLPPRARPRRSDEIRARIAAVVDVGLAAVAVTATVFVMNKDGYFHHRHLLAEARRHLALVQRGRRREPGLNDQVVDAALAEHCTDITEPRTKRGEEPNYRLYTARWSPAAPPPSRALAAAPGRDRKPAPTRPRPSCRWSRGSGTSRACRCDTTAPSSPPASSPPDCAPRAAPPAPSTARPRTSRHPSSCPSSPGNSRPRRRPARRSTSQPCAPTCKPWG
ncbi:MobF family relaxase [Streptomyces sp. NPDC056230]|uniref:MobF family relaxase n=1 Tax=Streptomyces sp. NPDC056230 TaxID=3345754 RepID=UPI0035DAD502